MTGRLGGRFPGLGPDDFEQLARAIAIAAGGDGIMSTITLDANPTTTATASGMGQLGTYGGDLYIHVTAAADTKWLNLSTLQDDLSTLAALVADATALGNLADDATALGALADDAEALAALADDAESLAALADDATALGSLADSEEILTDLAAVGSAAITLAENEADLMTIESYKTELDMLTGNATDWLAPAIGGGSLTVYTEEDTGHVAPGFEIESGCRFFVIGNRMQFDAWGVGGAGGTAGAGDGALTVVLAGKQAATTQLTGAFPVGTYQSDTTTAIVYGLIAPDGYRVALYKLTAGTMAVLTGGDLAGTTRALRLSFSVEIQ